MGNGADLQGLVNSSTQCVHPYAANSFYEGALMGALQMHGQSWPME